MRLISVIFFGITILLYGWREPIMKNKIEKIIHQIKVFLRKFLLTIIFLFTARLVTSHEIILKLKNGNNIKTIDSIELSFVINAQ